MKTREWIDLWNGRGIDEDGAYGNQCWDLAAKYAREIIGCPRLPTRPGGNGGAKDVYDYFLAPLGQYFDRVKNDPNNPNQVPQRGDLIVWGAPMGMLDGVAYGHIAIVVEAHPGQPTFRVFEQVASVGTATIATRNYKYVLGWLAPKQRPQFDHAEAPAPAETVVPPLPAGEFYVIQRGDTFWSLEEIWDIPHGTLQSLNASQNARELRIGQHIRVRPAAPTHVPQPPKPGENDLYTIQRGDTFWDLENTWGIDHGTLQRLNPHLNPRTLSIGQVIKRRETVAPTIESIPKPAAATPAAVPAERREPVEQEPVKPEPTEVDPAIQKLLDNSKALDEITRIERESVQTKPVLEIEGAAPKPSWFQEHFNREKVAKDLAAIGSFASGLVIFAADHYSLIAFLFTTLAGIIFGENRFKLKK